MLAEVKKCAEAHDIKGLRYIFVDCLDVDPTFEKYREDYEYCRKSVPELFVDHQELSGIVTDESKWTMDYWDRIKLDLMKNFSMIRFEHMIKVARVIYADKVARLTKERGIVSRDVVKTSPQKIVPETGHIETVSVKEAEDRRATEKKHESEEENKQKNAEKKTAQEADGANAKPQEFANGHNAHERDGKSKKATGVAVAVIAIVAIVLILIAKALS